jgi:hypothetical protein
MRLEWEDQEPVPDVTAAELRRRFGRKKGGDTNHAILERDDGSYVQMVGGGVACCLEWRDTTEHKHYRAFVDPPKVPWRDASKLGQMSLQPGEYLFVEDIVEAFCAFLSGSPFPGHLKWRDVTEELAAPGIARP